MALIDTITKSANHEISRNGNVLRMSPPLNIAAADVDQAIAIFDKSLEQAARE